jgi:hypothetical protein
LTGAAAPLREHRMAGIENDQQPTRRIEDKI